MAKPTHFAYTVRDFEKDGAKKSRWLEIGAMFTHGDGKGFDLILEAAPINGRITLRVNEPKEAPKDQAEG